MRHNSAVTRQNQRINWNFGTKSQNRFSHGSLKILVLRYYFRSQTPYCRITERSLGPTIFDRQAKSCHCQFAHHPGLSMYKVLLDSDKYLLSHSTLINLLETDVHLMTSQILSILIDSYPDLCAIFRSLFQSLDLYNFGTRKDIKKR